MKLINRPFWSATAQRGGADNVPPLLTEFCSLPPPLLLLLPLLLTMTMYMTSVYLQWLDDIANG